jgi:hypothetical protein
VTGVVEGMTQTTSVFALRTLVLAMILVHSRFAFAFALALPLSFDAIFSSLVNNDELLPLLLPPLPFEIRMQLVATIR